MTEYFDEVRRIPRRRSATPDTTSRQTQTGSQVVATRTKRKENESYNPYPMRPMVRNLSRAPLTTPKREYIIPLTDGTKMRVTERELEDLPEEYQEAAQLITSPPAKRQALPAPEAQTDDLSELRKRRFRPHGLLWLGLAMLVMIFGWTALSALGTWWTNQTNQWIYGYPRTYQVDANVGHGTTANPMSHFIAENLDKRIIVIEIAGDDPSKSKIYVGPALLGQGQELTPVTLSFEDMNNDGKPDLVIHVADSKFVFLNTGTGFKPAPNQ